MFNSENVALEVDVWETIESKLQTGIKNVLRVGYSSECDIPVVNIYHVGDSKVEHTHIKLSQEEDNELAGALSDRFNFSLERSKRLTVYVDVGGIPEITVTYIPYVDDASTLNQTKSRMNVLTVD